MYYPTLPKVDLVLECRTAGKFEQPLLATVHLVHRD